MVEQRRPGAREAWIAVAVALMVLAVAAAILAVLEGDIGEEFGDLTGLGGFVIAHYGAPASLVLLYVEESGVPLPVPGDVYVAYLGSRAHGSWLELIAAWLAIVVVVTLGSTNLYLLSRRYGHRLLTNRLSGLLHLDQERLDQVESWLRRWGAVTVIFGRHIPGFRIPITVMAGSFEIPYRVFAPSVAVSTAIWAGVWLALGTRYGPSVAHVLARHPWLYAAALGIAAVVAAVIGIRAWVRSRRAAA